MNKKHDPRPLGRRQFPLIIATSVRRLAGGGGAAGGAIGTPAACGGAPQVVYLRPKYLKNLK